MRDKFWSLFIELKFKSYYLDRYKAHAHRTDNVLSGVSLFTSAASISAWQIWQIAPWLWSAILVISQLLQVFKPKFPYAKRLGGLRYACPELRDLLIDLDKDWNHSEIHDASDDDYLNLIEKYERSSSQIVKKYLGSDELPRVRYANNAAETDCKSYFERRHNADAKEWRNIDATKE